MNEIIRLDQEYVAPTYARFPINIVKGKGSLAFDENGQEYIDMGSGIAVNLMGYCDDVWQQAVIAQLSSLQHTSNLYYTGPCAKLAEQLCLKTGMKKVFFCNSGAEANECAIKAARKYACEHKGSEYTTIITLKNSFHGRTLTTLAATGQDHFHELFQPLTPGFVHCEADNCEEMEKLVKENKTAAIMLECVQGEGGVRALSQEFVSCIAKLAKENDLIVIDDEVQAGNGRTGKLYAYMNYDLVPDVVTTAKGIGGGLPIGVTMLGEKVKDIFKPGDNGSTFGGNPAVCAGALSILNRLDDDFLKEVSAKSAYLFDQFKDAENVKLVSGMGLMIGIEPIKGTASDIAKECMKNHVLVLTAGGNKVRLLPALNIPYELLEKAAAVIKEALAKASE
ncbi:MAG: acetylornithine/succinylornithine family transaminase [Solobacterium sp.]|nr:acetylornithine/succinylornithine family transaminase [Solobacterium sp.]